MTIRLPAYFTRFGSKSDGSASLGFNTQELSPQDFATLKQDLNLFGWLVFKENEVQDEEIPDEEAEEDKKPSRRLRAALYVFHEQKGGKKEEFESFYREQMNKFINHVKSKLE